MQGLVTLLDLHVDDKDGVVHVCLQCAGVHDLAPGEHGVPLCMDTLSLQQYLLLDIVILAYCGSNIQSLVGGEESQQ